MFSGSSEKSGPFSAACWKPSLFPETSLFAAELFPGGGVITDDGSRGSRSNPGEPRARLQAQEIYNDEMANVEESFPPGPGMGRIGSLG
jgi:hypothetical protein